MLAYHAEEFDRKLSHTILLQITLDTLRAETFPADSAPFVFELIKRMRFIRYKFFFI